MSSKGKSWVWKRDRNEKEEGQRRIRESVRLANEFADQKMAELKNKREG